ncbi:AMP-binding protein [Streptomyces sp. AM 4-1-1]|uniref:class I adenylate-forming enzyme family protein n=1 Tax=Streptomyces sp. AM 4-1-1 TaxID=3028710 RepID=UPI0023B88FDC|nr:AMP-binding protein [Streptomyces sp. AM 4-1-1]WEH32258.1 AMP-binding protein [Streptomyces sp. AM 4-1-1]
MSASETYVNKILEVLSSEPEKTVLTWRGGTVTAAGFDASVRTAAHVLHRHGSGAENAPADSGDTAGTGTVVAILTVTNSPATLILRYAANLAGATVVHLHTTNAVDPDDRIATEAELQILKETGATVLAVDADHLALARELRALLDTPLTLAALGDLGPGVLDLTDGDPKAFDPAAVEIDPTRTAVVTYTSGTTGKPKGIAVDFRTRNGFIAAGLRMGWRAVYLATLPMSHSSGQTTDDSLASGGAAVLHDGFDAGEVLRAVAEHRVTRLLVSPPQLYLLMDHPDLTATDLSSLQMLCYTGCPASPRRLAAAAGIFGDALIQVYGTGEAGAISMLTPAEHKEPELLDTAGRPLLGEVRIRDPHDGRDLATGETGEICVRSPFAMKGYVGDPGLTARTLRDGWLHTGDLGSTDERGYIHIRGRVADVLKTNGIKIHPVTVENALLAHPDVVQAAAFGVRDRDRTEYLHAAVVLRDGAGTTADALRDHVAAELTPKHVPRGITVHPQLPLTGAGKPDRTRLAANAGG